MANVAAEKLLLAGLVRHPDEFFEYCTYLGADNFSSEGAKLTFEALQSLMMEKDAQTVSKAKLVSAAKALGHVNYLATVRNGDWLDELFAEQVTVQELTQHFLEVQRQSLASKYVQATEDVRQYLKTTDDPLHKIIGYVEDTIVQQVTMLDRGEHSISYLTKDARKKIQALAEDPGQLGIDLGYPIWQNRIGQLRNGGITFVVGTTGSGKSQFGLRAAVTAAHKAGLPVLLLDSELNANDQLIRTVAMLAEVPYDIIECGYWNMTRYELIEAGVDDQEEIERIEKYAARLKDDRFWAVAEKLPIEYVSISGLGVQEALPHIRRWLLTRVKPDLETKAPQCLIVYDYLKLATVDEIRGGRIAEWQSHGLNMSALHDLMKKYNVPALVFGQTNNQIDNGIQCVAGGKRISENATSVSYFKRKTEEEKSMDGNGSHLWRVFKARYGKGTHAGYINCAADLSIGKFNELGLGTVNFEEERRKMRTKNNDDDDK
jgi:replicative DNA helicase